MASVGVFLEERPFSAYGASHWALLAVVAVLAVVLVRAGRAHRATPRGRRLARRFALVLAGVQAAFQLYSMLPPHWDLAASLPFQLCDLAWIAAAAALWTRARSAGVLLYYWGLTLTAQGLLTPALRFDFPHLQFLMFAWLHGAVVLAAIYSTWGLGERPSWRGYVVAAAVTIGWGFLMLAFNTAFGTNYLYVSAKPASGSVLDLLGDWPWYLVWEVAILLALWALITWPWCRTSAAAGAAAGAGGPSG
jgi:hypothetical integral membrane protein (TIGR02206 family)